MGWKVLAMIERITPDLLLYSTVAKSSKNTVLYSKEESDELFKNLSDVITSKNYWPWYRSKLKELGKDKFMELAAKARKGSDTPQVLFKWMLLNPDEVN